jgi:hypothetical protein
MLKILRLLKNDEVLGYQPEDDSPKDFLFQKVRKKEILWRLQNDGQETG